jgi:hypothetical protein
MRACQLLEYRQVQYKEKEYVGKCSTLQCINDCVPAEIGRYKVLAELPNSNASWSDRYLLCKKTSDLHNADVSRPICGL